MKKLLSLLVGLVLSVNAFAGITLPSQVSYGICTPTFTFATPGDLAVTYSEQDCNWVKVDRLVNVNMVVTASAFTYTTASGNLRIAGLPFPAENVGNERALGGAVIDNITLDAGYSFVTPVINGNASVIQFLESGSGSTKASAVLTTTNLATTILPTVKVTISYIAAQ